MANTSVEPIFGASPLSRLLSTAESEQEAAEAVFKRLEEGGVKTLDVTRDWNGAEAYLGKVKAAPRFTINSKTPGGIIPGTSTSSGIVEHAKELASHVGAENVDVYVIHAPDETLDLADMCKGMNDAYAAGYFRRFGLSNFTAEEVEEVYAICKERGYVLPTTYEGNYNAVARRPEKLLMPTLRRLGMSFYAYSPMAGGFLTKTAKQLEAGGAGAGRFGREGLAGMMYNALYNKPSYMKALEMWSEAAKEAGCSNAELAYRWAACDSALSREHGDALLFGCSKPEQISEILEWLKKGSVGEQAKATIERIWELVEDDAPIDNYQTFAKDYLKAGRSSDLIRDVAKPNPK